MDLYAKQKTFVLKASYDFNNLIPSMATSVIFTNEIMPISATLINVDKDGDKDVYKRQIQYAPVYVISFLQEIIDMLLPHRIRLGTDQITVCLLYTSTRSLPNTENLQKLVSVCNSKKVNSNSLFLTSRISQPVAFRY